MQAVWKDLRMESEINNNNQWHQHAADEYLMWEIQQRLFFKRYSHLLKITIYINTEKNQLNQNDNSILNFVSLMYKLQVNTMAVMRLSGLSKWVLKT